MACFSSSNSFAYTPVQEELNLIKYWNKVLCDEKSNVKNDIKIKDFKNDLIDISVLVNKKQTAIDSLSISQIDHLFKQLQKRNFKLALTFAQFHYAKLLYSSGKSAEAIELMMFAKEFINSISYQNISDFSFGSFYGFLGQIYADNGESQLALQYLYKAIENDFCNSKDEYYCWGNIGLIYYKSGNTKEALAASFKALDIVTKVKDTTEVSNISGNIGAIYIKEGSFSQAIDFLQVDYQGSIKYKNWQSAIAVKTLMAKAYNKLEEYENAFKALHMADSIEKACKCMSRGSKRDYYEELGRYFAVKNNLNAYKSCMDSFIYYSNLLNSQARSNISKISGTELKVASQIYQAKTKLIESEKQRQLLLRNFIIFIVVALLIIFILIFRNLKGKQRSDRKIYKLNLENSKKLLNTYIENIRSKNQLLEELQGKLTEQPIVEELEIASEILVEENTDFQIDINAVSLMTGDGWLEFSELVEQVHRDFFKKLNEQFPNLTPAEIRLLTLIKLGCSIKESAGMLGISAESVRKARYRLRKKLNIDEKQTLETLMELL